MRSKVVLIKGFGNISPKITIAEYERINADSVVLMAALRYPQLIPENLYSFSIDLAKLQSSIVEIMSHWHREDMCHILSAEYANVVSDRSGKEVKAVEGESLTVPWFYDTIRSYHRLFGQTVVDSSMVS